MKKKKNLINFIKKKNLKLVYFLDYGALSLNYLNIIINNNSNTQLCYSQ